MVSARTKRYRYLRSLGFSPNEARRFRDYGIKNYNAIIYSKKIIFNKSLTKLRVRRQIVRNYTNISKNPYYASFRAITINPEYSERILNLAIKQVINDLKLDLSDFTFHYTGLSSQRIPNTEDRMLNDYKIHIEIKIRKEKPIYTTISHIRI